MNFQNLTVFSSVKLEHYLDNFTLGLIFYKRPLVDKTLIQLTNLVQRSRRTTDKAITASTIYYYCDYSFKKTLIGHNYYLESIKVKVNFFVGARSSLARSLSLKLSELFELLFWLNLISEIADSSPVEFKFLHTS